ncbi:hypothetical protein JW905_10830, partial [bacterium]|nr:hypothetical protein [candidate division CSSED10-310 bacterium]
MKQVFVLVVLMSMLLCHPAMAAWHVELMQDARGFWDMGPGFMALDTQGRPHLAYGYDHCYYAWRDSATWRYELIDGSPGVGYEASIAVRGTDDVHAAYGDIVENQVRYAHRGNGGTWSIVQIAGGQGVGHCISLALNDAGLPGIAYFDRYNGTLKLAEQSAGGSWSIRTPAAGLMNPSRCALAYIDDKPNIVYSNSAGVNTMHHVYWDGAAWRDLVPDGSGHSQGAFLSLAGDAGGFAHIAYTDNTDSVLKYVTYQPGGWPGVPETVDDVQYVGWYCSIRVTGTGDPIVSYYGGSAGLKLARRDDAVWTTGVVHSSIGTV